MQPTLRGHLKRACKKISYLETPTREVGLKNPYLICDYYGGSHEADECELNNPSKQVCLSGGDIYDDPSLLRFYQNDDTSPWGNIKRKEKEEDDPDWTVRSKFEDELANVMLKKKFHTNGLGDMLILHPSQRGKPKKKSLRAKNKALHKSPSPGHPFFTNLPRHPIYLSRPLMKQKKDDEDERLLLIFKQFHINMPFLEAMIHMPKGAKVLKYLLLYKDQLEKVASLVKLNEECSAII
ncbi:hypothetical protein Tco_0332456 [Tanacetum coccineum]